jgi:hypothetical protein
MAIHPATGEIYVAGYTASSGFPKIAGGARTIFGGAFDGFVTRLSADLKARVQSTFLGGIADDFIQAIAIDPKTARSWWAA